MNNNKCYTKLKSKWVAYFEENYLRELLEKNQGNVSQTAKQAKLDRSNLLRLLRKHNIKAKLYRTIV